MNTSLTYSWKNNYIDGTVVFRCSCRTSAKCNDVAYTKKIEKQWMARFITKHFHKIPTDKMEIEATIASYEKLSGIFAKVDRQNQGQLIITDMLEHQEDIKNDN